MLECLILGDGLAVGIGQVRKECVTYAKSGINSYNYVNSHILNTAGNTEARTIVISLGSNDLKNIKTFEELDTLRQLVKADRVYWILPAVKDDKRQAVYRVAQRYKDIVIDSRKHQLSDDRVHPTYAGYKSISEETK
jgi:lysophospholipase L1-like esterase